MMDTINNRYEVIRKLGEGGMGKVFLVRDLLKDSREMALKLLFRDHFSPSRLSLFKKEFEELRHLFHPNIARVYDFGRLAEDEGYFFTSEYIEGKEFGPPFVSAGEEEILDILIQILRALSYIHERSLIHNDLKPSNLLIKRSSHQSPLPKLIDFGLAGKKNLRKTERLYGTIHYLAPEKIRQGVSSPGTDLYSLGVTLYLVFTGRLPFGGKSLGAVMEAHLLEPPSPPEKWNEKISPFFSALILRLLEKDAQKRPPSCEALLEEINRIWNRKIPLYSPSSLQSTFLKGPLVGRKKEIQKIHQFINQGESSRFVLIEGEAGSGKTRLLEELRYQSQLKGSLFCRGRCYPQGDLLSPMAQILKKLIFHLSPSHRLVKKRESHLLWILKGAGSAGEDRSLFWKEASFFLQEAGEEVPLMVALEDVHHLALDSLNLLEAFLESLSPSFIPFLLTRQSSPSFSEREMEGPFLRIFLEPLKGHHLREWIQARFPSLDFSQVDHLSQELYSRMEGNPRFWEEMFQHSLERGWIYFDGRWRVEEGEILSLEVEGIPSLLEKKLREMPLSPAGGRILSYLSLLQGPVDQRELKELMGLSEGEWRREVQNLKNRMLLDIKLFPKEGKERIFLRHEVVGLVWCRSLSERQKRELWEEIAQFFATRVSPGEGARYFLKAGKPHQAREYLLKALPQAFGLGEYHLFLEDVKGLLLELPGDPELTLALAQLYDRLGEVPMAFSLLASLRERELKDPMLFVELARFYKRNHRPQMALEWLEKAEAQGFSPTDEMVFERAGIYRGQKKFPQALALLEGLFSHLSENSSLFWETGYSLGVLKNELGHPGEALKIFKTLEKKEWGKAREGLLCMAQAWARGGMGDLEESLRWFEKGMDKARELSSLQLGEFYLEWAENFLEKNPQWSRGLLTISLQLLEDLGPSSLLGRTNFLLGKFFFFQGKKDGAFLHYSRAEKIYSSLKLILEKALCLRSLGELCSLDGNFSRGRSFYREALGLFKALDVQEFLPGVAFELGWAAVMESQYEEGRAYLSEALTLALKFSLKELTRRVQKLNRAVEFFQKREPLSSAVLQGLTFSSPSARDFFLDLSIYKKALDQAFYEDFQQLSKKKISLPEGFPSETLLLATLQGELQGIWERMEWWNHLYREGPFLKEVKGEEDLEGLEKNLQERDLSFEKIRDFFFLGHFYFLQYRYQRALAVYVRASRELKAFLEGLSRAKQKTLLQKLDLEKCLENIGACERELEGGEKNYEC